MFIDSYFILEFIMNIDWCSYLLGTYILALSSILSNDIGKIKNVGFSSCIIALVLIPLYPAFALIRGLYKGIVK